jgi:selenocysteine-specific elongation factor
MLVIGGGNVVDAHPPKRQKSAGAAELAERETLPIEEVVAEALDRAGAKGLTFDTLRVNSGLAEAALHAALEKLAAEGRALAGRRNVWLSSDAVKEMEESVITRLAKLHNEDPRRAFIPLNVVAAIAPAEARECLRLALIALVKESKIMAAGERLRLPTHVPQWTGKYAQARERVLTKCQECGLSVPTVEEFAALIGFNEKECQQLLEVLVDNGELLLLAEGIYLHPATLTHCRAQVEEFLAKHEKMTVGQARDLLNASRKYLLPFLERLDREGITVRQGDYRTLRRKPTIES